MNGDRDSRDPNVDTFDHVGEREHEPINPITVEAIRIGPPASDRGEIFAPGSIKPGTRVPVTRLFNSDEIIGTALVDVDGKATITLAPGVAAAEGTIKAGLGFRALRYHHDGDVRVFDEIEILTVGVEYTPAGQVQS